VLLILLTPSLFVDLANLGLGLLLPRRAGE